VDLLGSRISSRPRVAEQNSLTRAAKRERGGEATGAASDDDDVIEHVESPRTKLTSRFERSESRDFDRIG
jgi:hypothetical protein